VCLNGSGQKTLVEASTRIKKKNLEKKELTKAHVDLAQVLVDYAASRRLARTRVCFEIAELKRRQKEMEMENVRINDDLSANLGPRDGYQKPRFEIAELKRRQKEMETEYVRIDEDLRAKLGPLYGYQKPKNELKIEAYKLYEEDCKSKGIVAISKYREMGFKKAMEAFGDIAKESCRRNFVTYLNDPVRKENIENHFKGMILKFPGDKTDPDVAKFVYKFACEVSDSDEPPYSKRAQSGNNQPEEQEVHNRTAKKMKYEL
jgi:ribosomal protein L31E